MRTTRPTAPRAALRLLAAMLLAAVMDPARSGATACDPSIFEPVPDCQTQQQAPVQYGAWETQGWAYYCGGDHPYYWGMASANQILNFSFDNSCFSVTEDVFGENNPNVFDATITNWCFWSSESITMTLGCSKQMPPNFSGRSCGSYVGGPVSDPGCPSSNVSNHCSGTNPPVCYLTSKETCSNGTSYDCTALEGVVWCYQCAGN